MGGFHPAPGASEVDSVALFTPASKGGVIDSALIDLSAVPGPTGLDPADCDD